MKNHITLSRMYNQSVSKTWDSFKDFGKVQVPGATVTVQGESNTIGCIRTIQYDNDIQVIERLDAYVDNPSLQSLFSYSFPEPMLGVQAYSGTVLVYPAGRDGSRSKIDWFCSWEPDNEESNEAFEAVIVNLLQNGYLAAPDAKQEE